MAFIVMDLEWNQAMSANSSVYNYLPIHLGGEIIQIGAVKLDENFYPTEEFQSDVKPVYFRKMHYKVKKLTGIDKDRLSHGDTFPTVFERFRSWCGDRPVFLTWGNDDRRIMEQNIIIHDLDWDWIDSWVNLQTIYNLQTDGDKNQKSLATAMEHFEIEQTRVAHDALGDAYNTGLVCSKLDMRKGLQQYAMADTLLTRRFNDNDGDASDSLEHRSFSGYSARSEAFADRELVEFRCPDCGGELGKSAWVNQGDHRYMNLAACPEHGKFLVRLKFRKQDDESWSVNRIIYRADEKMEKMYRDKSVQGRHRTNRHRGGSRKAH